MIPSIFLFFVLLMNLLQVFIAFLIIFGAFFCTLYFIKFIWNLLSPSV